MGRALVGAQGKSSEEDLCRRGNETGLGEHRLESLAQGVGPFNSSVKTAAREDRGTVGNLRAHGHHDAMSNDDTVREWPAKPPQAPVKV